MERNLRSPGVTFRHLRMLPIHAHDAQASRVWVEFRQETPTFFYPAIYVGLCAHENYGGFSTKTTYTAVWRIRGKYSSLMTLLYVGLESLAM
jgi:hypothetical protein